MKVDCGETGCGDLGTIGKPTTSQFKVAGLLLGFGEKIYQKRLRRHRAQLLFRRRNRRRAFVVQYISKNPRRSLGVHQLEGCPVAKHELYGDQRYLCVAKRLLFRGCALQVAASR